MHRKGRAAPFTLLTLILLFGKKKPPEELKTRTTAETTAEALPVPDNLKKSITATDVAKARDRLRLANLERDIIGDALTKIYEAETKGQISEPEKNQFLQRYKTDLKRVDGEIDTHKKTVDLYELESAKEDLVKSFQEKIMEIDLRIRQIRPTISITPEPKTVEAAPPARQDQEQTPSASTASAPRERPAREKPKNKAEERLETIREEVLKAMERLEQIETEG